MAVTTLGLIAGALLAGQTATGVIGARKNAKAARKQGEFEGGMYDKAAEDAIERGGEAASQVAASGRTLTGSQRAALAASGVDVGSGSAKDVISNDQRLNALDIATIHNNADREAYGLRQQGQFARMGGRNAAAGYNNQAYSTLLGGAAEAMRRYDSFGLRSDKTKAVGGINRYAQ